MQIHQVQTKNKDRKPRRVGRGGKRGTYSGRGMKGQGARAGTRFQPRVREILKRYPKRRGYERDSISAVATLNVEVLEKAFQKGEVVTPQALVAKNLVSRKAGRVPPVKILGQGDLKTALTIEGCQVSKSAKEKIEKAGGTVTS